MGSDDRSKYDDLHESITTERKEAMAALDSKLTEFKNSAKFDEMTAAEKQKFMSQFTYEMGNNMKQMMQDRESDDTIRNEAGFF